MNKHTINYNWDPFGFRHNKDKDELLVRCEVEFMKEESTPQETDNHHI